MTGLVLFLLMEGLWIGAVAVLADGLIAGTARLQAAIVVLAYPVALVLARPLSRITSMTLWCGAQALASMAATALLIATLVPGLSSPAASPTALWEWISSKSEAQSALALCVVTLFCWVRGVMLAGHRLDAQAVALGFQIGLVALIAVQGWAWAVDLALPGAIAVNIGFVCTALLALWHVRAARRGGVSSPILAITMVLACAGLAALALNPGLLAVLLDMLHGIWRALRDAMIALLALLPEPDYAGMDLPAPTGEAMPAPPARPEPVFEPIAWMRMLFNIIFFGGIALLLGSILLANLLGLLAWLRRRLNETPGIAHDRSRRSLRDTLRQAWQEIRTLLAGALRTISRGIADTLTFRRAADVLERRRYRALLRELEGRGWPRRSHETPAEYARRLRAQVWPGPGGDLATLSRAYSASRYGGVRPSENRFSRLWKKTRRSLRKVTIRQ
ncbi:MAG: DUF4129 domain-containing protein [Salinarimonas sp.]